MSDAKSSVLERSHSKLSVSGIKPPVTDKSRVKQTFRNACSIEFPVIRKSALSIYHAFCTVCSTDITVEHAGKSVITKHLETDAHPRRIPQQH